jgi:hypothetical protein
MNAPAGRNAVSPYGEAVQSNIPQGPCLQQFLPRLHATTHPQPPRCSYRTPGAWLRLMGQRWLRDGCEPISSRLRDGCDVRAFEKSDGCGDGCATAPQPWSGSAKKASSNISQGPCEAVCTGDQTARRGRLRCACQLALADGLRSGLGVIIRQRPGGVRFP